MLEIISLHRETIVFLFAKQQKLMNRVLSVLCVMMLCVSCSSTFDINGTSNVSKLDGRKLYLKVYNDSELKNIDSCDVIHGQFNFGGPLDSVQIAHIFMNDENVMPVVLESGPIQVRLDDSQMGVEGTPLNEALTEYNKEMMKLNGELQEMAHEEYQGIANNKDMEEVYRHLLNRQQKLNQKVDDLTSHFVIDNFENVLGPWAFMMYVSRYQYPITDAWIEDIMNKAPATFKNNVYVKDYYDKAMENEKIMNGMKDVDTVLPPVTDPNATPAPTPNELAKPSTPAE